VQGPDADIECKKISHSILRPEVIQLPNVLQRPRPVFAASRHQRMWRVYMQLSAINNIRNSPPTGSSGRLAPSGVHLFIIVAPTSGDATTGGFSAGDSIRPSSFSFISSSLPPVVGSQQCGRRYTNERANTMAASAQN